MVNSAYTMVWSGVIPRIIFKLESTHKAQTCARVCFLKIRDFFYVSIMWAKSLLKGNHFLIWPGPNQKKHFMTICSLPLEWWQPESQSHWQYIVNGTSKYSGNFWYPEYDPDLPPKNVITFSLGQCLHTLKKNKTERGFSQLARVQSHQRHE